MRPEDKRGSGQSDLFRSRLDQIVNMNYALAKLGALIDWRFLVERFGSAYRDGPGHPPRPTRLMAGLAILKAMHKLSDEVLCARWLENPYYQLFCGEAFFATSCRSTAPRSRIGANGPSIGSGGEEKRNALIDESLAATLRCGTAKPAGFTKAVADTTVLPKAVAFPTDARLMFRARERLVALAQKLGIDLRQTYVRVGKEGLIQHRGDAHAKQCKRAKRGLRRLKTYLGRVIRDLARKSLGDPQLEAACAKELMLARRVHDQNKNLRRVKGLPSDAGLRVCSLHAPDVEGIGKGKAHKPYEFGVKLSVATTLARSKGGQFVTHVKALPGKPYDGHTLAAAIPEITSQTEARLQRIFADAGYRGHNAPPTHRFKVYTSSQKRGATKRETRRRGGRTRYRPPQE